MYVILHPDSDGEPTPKGLPPSDASLIERSLKDPELFGVIFERHHAAISRYLYQRLGDAAEDLTARTFMAAFEHRHRYDRSRGDAKPWLFGITTNILRHHLRDERRRLISLAGLQPQGNEPDIADAIVTHDELARAGWALAALDPRDRDALLLHIWAELTYDQIGVALEIPTGTAKSRVHRARAKVRERLGNERASTEQEET
jgi:RNA polymerase sigma-70 factor (ECF subfamily)